MQCGLCFCGHSPSAPASFRSLRSRARRSACLWLVAVALATCHLANKNNKPPQPSPAACCPPPHPHLVFYQIVREAVQVRTCSGLAFYDTILPLPILCLCVVSTSYKTNNYIYCNNGVSTGNIIIILRNSVSDGGVGCGVGCRMPNQKGCVRIE